MIFLARPGSCEVIRRVLEYADTSEVIAMSETCRTLRDLIRDHAQSQLTLLCHLHARDVSKIGASIPGASAHELTLWVWEVERNIDRMQPRKVVRYESGQRCYADGRYLEELAYDHESHEWLFVLCDRAMSPEMDTGSEDMEMSYNRVSIGGAELLRPSKYSFSFPHHEEAGVIFRSFFNPDEELFVVCGWYHERGDARIYLQHLTKNLIGIKDSMSIVDCMSPHPLADCPCMDFEEVHSTSGFNCEVTFGPNYLLCFAILDEGERCGAAYIIDWRRGLVIRSIRCTQGLLSSLFFVNDTRIAAWTYDYASHDGSDQRLMFFDFDPNRSLARLTIGKPFVMEMWPSFHWELSECPTGEVRIPIMKALPTLQDRLFCLKHFQHNLTITQVGTRLLLRCDFTRALRDEMDHFDFCTNYHMMGWLNWKDLLDVGPFRVGMLHDNPVRSHLPCARFEVTMSRNSSPIVLGWDPMRNLDDTQSADAFGGRIFQVVESETGPVILTQTDLNPRRQRCSDFCGPRNLGALKAPEYAPREVYQHRSVIPGYAAESIQRDVEIEGAIGATPPLQHAYWSLCLDRSSAAASNGQASDRYNDCNIAFDGQNLYLDDREHLWTISF